MEIIVVILAGLAASFVASVAGFGGSVIMLPVLVWVFGIQDAVPIMAVVSLIGNLSRVGLNRQEVDWPVVWRFAAGAVPAAVAGGIIFVTAPAAVLVRGLGAFLLLMLVYRHSRWGRNVHIKRNGFLPLGAVSGLLSAMLGTAGPFAAPFFLAYGLIKGAYIGTEAMTAAVMHVTKLAVYGGYSLVGTRTLLVGLGIGAVAILGTWLGKKTLDRVPEQLFPYIIEVMLLVAGVLFLVQG